MPAVSKAQQKFMGMVHAAQKGEEPASAEVEKAAKDMSDKSAKDFASTKHKGLPNHIDEAINPEVFREFMQACNDAGLNSFQIFGMHVLVYILTLGATGATILSALGIAQLAKDAKDTFNNWNAGRKLNPQKVKEIVKDFENKVNKLEGGRKKFFKGIINKMKRTNPEDKSSLVSINRDLEHYAKAYGIKEGRVSTKHTGLPNKVVESSYDSETDDLVSAIVVNPARVESKLPKPTNEILWKATGKVCEGRGMAERVKMYEKKGGGWRMGENRDEQVYNSIKEFYYNEVKKQNVKEVSDFVDEGGEGDHEVSMARNALQAIARNSQEIMGKIGINEKDIPGWIQDHISQANSFLNQVAQNYHEVEGDANMKDNFVTNNPNNQSNGK
jgi:hypothetical protein